MNVISMAREGGAVTGVVCGVMYCLNVRKASKVDKKSAEHSGTDGRNNTLALGRCDRGGLGLTGAD